MKALWLRFAAPLLVGAISVASPAFADDAGAKPPAAKKDDKPKDDKQKDAKKPVEDQYGLEVTVLHATNNKKGIDSRIGDMPQLKNPPFSAYDSYELLSKTRLTLTKEERTMTLPNRRVLKEKLLEVMADKDHVRFSATINQPGGKTSLPLLEVKAKLGQAFIVAGQKHKGGILVLVIRVVK